MFQEMSTNQASKIVELEDDQYLSEELSDFEMDENEFPIKFKQSVLRNKRFFWIMFYNVKLILSLL